VALRASFINSAAKTAYAKTDKVLGRGGFGVISLALEENTLAPRALKVVKRRDTWDQNRLQMEAKILQNLDHPHILRIFSWFQRVDSIHMLTEVSTGGELLQVVRHAVCKGEAMPEAWVITAFRQVLEALAYIHRKGIVHKDVKGENLLLLRSTRSPSGETFFRAPHVVVCDLGLAEVCRREKGALRAVFVAGTPRTMAPEVWHSNFSTACDIWSTGCIVFQIFSGKPPFQGECDSKGRMPDELLSRGPDWRFFSGSDESQSFCRKLLSYEPDQRPTAAECLSHDWFKGAMPSITSEETICLCRALHQWGKKQQSQRAFSLMLAAGSPNLSPIAEMYSKLDVDHSGTLDIDKMVSGLMATGVDKATAETMAHSLDMNNDGICGYLEFFAAALPSQPRDFKALLRQQFVQRDVHNAGMLGRAEMAALFGELEVFAKKHSWTLPTSDFDDNVKVSFEVFCSYFGHEVKDEIPTNVVDSHLEKDIPSLLLTVRRHAQPVMQSVHAQPGDEKAAAAQFPQGTSGTSAVCKKDRFLTRLMSGLDPKSGCSDWTQWPFLLKWPKLPGGSRAKVQRKRVVSL